MEPNRKLKLLSFGEILWDIIDGRTYIGGAPFNLAAHAARCGIDSYLLTRIGTDELGQRALDEIARMEVDGKYVQTDARRPTGTVTVSVAAGGQPSYIIHNDVAWDFIDVQKRTAAQLAAERFDVVCFGTLAQRGAVSRASLVNVLKALKGVPVFYDVNLRQDYYSRKLILEGLKSAMILKLNDTEVTALSELIFEKRLKPDEFIKALPNEFPVKIVLVTMGARGCFAAENGHAQMVSGRQVEVADTVGAGDAFSAAFLASWLRGRTVMKSVEMGNVLGAFVASHSGAIPDYDAKIRRCIELGGQ